MINLTIECFRTLEPISGGWDGGMAGWLSLGGAIYRAPTVLIKTQRKISIDTNAAYNLKKRAATNFLATFSKIKRNTK